MKIKKFEDLESWKKARQLTNAVYQANCHGQFRKGLWLEGSDSTRIDFDTVEYRRGLRTRWR
jgi:hypothetical protein